MLANQPGQRPFGPGRVRGFDQRRQIFLKLIHIDSNKFMRVHDDTGDTISSDGLSRPNIRRWTTETDLGGRIPREIVVSEPNSRVFGSDKFVSVLGVMGTGAPLPTWGPAYPIGRHWVWHASDGHDV